MYRFWKFENGWLHTSELEDGSHRLLDFKKVLLSDEAVIRFGQRLTLGHYQFSTYSQYKPQTLTTIDTIAENRLIFDRFTVNHEAVRLADHKLLDFILSYREGWKMDYVLPKVSAIIEQPEGSNQYVPRNLFRSICGIPLARGVLVRDNHPVKLKLDDTLISFFVSEGEVKFINRPEKTWFALLQTLPTPKIVRHIQGGVLICHHL